jgi:hypothetical protein
LDESADNEAAASAGLLIALTGTRPVPVDVMLAPARYFGGMALLGLHILSAYHQTSLWHLRFAEGEEFMQGPAMIDTAQEQLEPFVNRMVPWHWVVAAIPVGIFLGFIDTLAIATVLGYLRISLPGWVGIPTTFTGFLCTGWLAGRMAPRSIVWQPPFGIFLCTVLVMLGYMGLRGLGALNLFFHYLIIPGLAAAICYAGLRIGRDSWKGFIAGLTRRKAAE